MVGVFIKFFGSFLSFFGFLVFILALIVKKIKGEKRKGNIYTKVAVLGGVLWLVGTMIFSAGISIYPEPKTVQTSNSYNSSPESKDAISDSKSTSLTESMVSESLSKIKVKVDFQDLLNDENKQKVVVYITNTSEYQFDGSVYVDLIDASGIPKDGDVIFVEKLAPQGQTYSILWLKPQGLKYSTKIKGSFTRIPIQNSKFPYEIVNTKTGLNYITFCVVVPQIDKDGLIQVVKEFKSKYNKDNIIGFQIYFFTDKQSVNAKAADYESADANYAANYSSGLSELSIFDEKGTIKVD
jgi:hypothetical protein